jgi:hypothetical protein
LCFRDKGRDLSLALLALEKLGDRRARDFRTRHAFTPRFERARRRSTHDGTCSILVGE